MLSERLTGAHPETRVLYMSEHSQDAVQRHGVGKSSSQFIQKPFSVDALAHKVRETLPSPGKIPQKVTK